MCLEDKSDLWRKRTGDRKIWTYGRLKNGNTGRSLETEKGFFCRKAFELLFRHDGFRSGV
jgi:hypothetical protein